MVSRAASALVGMLAVLVATGCGLGRAPGRSGVTVTVTRDFGAGRLGWVTEAAVPASQTVAGLLERRFGAATGSGGVVDSINGQPASAGRGWFYYVNGVKASSRPAVTSVHRSDRIWWDLHDPRAAQSIPAVVGSFPEPFVHGTGGKRLPTVLECAGDVPAACARVSRELTAIGVPVARQLIGTGSGTDSLAVVVGTWREVRGEIVGRLIEQGPGASGVFARFAGTGRSLQLLDPQARPARTLGAGAGLIAATASGSSEPTWLITGTDAEGVSAAAAALTPKRLADHFALAVLASADLRVPLETAR
jgi:hypothetical protein